MNNMIDFSLTEEQLLLQKTCRRFAEKEIKPIAAEYDRRPDPAERIIPREYYVKAAKLGLSKIMASEEHGGGGLGNLGMAIAIEEFAAADCGFAMVMDVVNIMSYHMTQGLFPERIHKWFKEKEAAEGVVLVAGTVGEPVAGGTEAWCEIPDPKLGIKAYARLEGDEWVINGSKHMWGINAGIADCYTVFARTDMTKPQTEATSIFFIPAGTPGLSLGKFHDKIGLRTAAQTEVFLDDVRVPNDFEMVPNVLAFPRLLPLYACVGFGAMAVGVARAALEYCIEYAKQRVTWGKPIIEHQAVAMMLADMKIDVEASRLLTWYAAWTNDQYRDAIVYHSRGPVQKVFNTEAAIRVTQKAINILGGYGLDNALPVEKWHRDVLPLTIADIHNNILRLQIAESMWMEFPIPSVR
jgi:alkylation response protein AidB-like acyl-CoA dehydrogenase